MLDTTAVNRERFCSGIGGAQSVEFVVDDVLNSVQAGRDFRAASDKTMKRATMLLLAAGVIAAGVWVAIAQRQAAARQALEQAKAERAAELEKLRNERRGLAPLVLPTGEAVAPGERVVRPGAVEPGVSNAAIASETNTQVDANTAAEISAAANLLAGKGKKVWQDPVAREALSFVGQDAEAEAIWVEAINNPDLPAKERQDLIEDLNEEGFADPKNLTLDDLPLILSRLALIEEHAPNAMDDVNAAAFAEAYKDLMNMAARLMQR